MNQPTATPVQQYLFVKSALAEYKRQGVPADQAATLLSQNLSKLGQSLGVKQAMPGDEDNSLSEAQPSVWETISNRVKQSIMGALAGGAVGGVAAGGLNALIGHGLSGLDRNSMEDALASTTDPQIQQMLQQSLAQHSPAMDTLAAGVRGAIPGAAGGAAVGGMHGLMGKMSGDGAYSGKKSYSADALKAPKAPTLPKQPQAPKSPATTTDLKPVTPAKPEVAPTKSDDFYDKTAAILTKINERTQHENKEQS